MSEAPEKTEEQAEKAGHPLGFLVTQSWYALLWERLWPPAAAALVVIGIFLAVSWAGLWISIPPLARIAVLFVFGLLLAVSLSPFLWFRLPQRSDALRRLDRGSGLEHRPATAVSDRLSNSAGDPVMEALWRAHRTKAEKAARDIRPSLPTPRLAWRDPYAIRALVLLAAVATFFAAKDDHTRRIAAAFDWSGAVASKLYRVDAWVTPPPYTGRAPILLPGIRHDQPHQKEIAALTVPTGSELIVRATGLSSLDLSTQGGITEENTADTKTGSVERRFKIAQSGAVSVSGLSGGRVTWPFNAIPDLPPKVSFQHDPESAGRGILTLSYRLEDDYGIASAEANFAQLSPAPEETAPRPLVAPPDFPLTLPQAHTRAGNGQTSKDISEHPWAGATVLLTLKAKDDAGNEGASETRELQLPERAFTKDVARALVEQRRILALDANARGKVGRALLALMIAPDHFTPDSGIYLGLRTAFTRLKLAKTDADLVALLGYLWSVAIQIEDGNMSDVDRELRAAEDALRQALQNGASDEEIKRLTDNLREKLERFMQALAEQLKQQEHADDTPLDRNTRVVRPQDLKNMLDRIENLAKNGAHDAARKLLDEMQAMLDNLSRNKQARGNPSDGDSDPLGELGRMIQQQQRLRDKTYRQGRQQEGQENRNGRNSQPNDRNRRAYGDLRDNQQNLRQKLEQMLEALKNQRPGDGQNENGQEKGQGGQSGNDPGQQANDALGRAGQAMRDAEGALEGGDSYGAVDSQARALQNLRKGAQSLADAMQGQGEGKGESSGHSANGTDRTDPLGRPMRSREYGEDFSVKIPGEIDVQRARRVLEELRRRFSDPTRPRPELDYLERLLQNF